MGEVNLAQNTPEWLIWRNTGIGGSDAPVIDGSSPHKTIRTLHLEKRGMVSEDDAAPNEYISAKGHKTEAFIRKQFYDLTKVEMLPKCFVHDKHTYLKASLDGYHSDLGVLEAKLVGEEVLKIAREKGTIPLHHFIQMQHQMEVVGTNKGNWFGHDGKKNGIIIPVEYSPMHVDDLLKKEHLFWQDLENNIVPPLSDRDYLVPEDLAVLTELRDAKELIANAEVNYEILKLKVADMYRHPRIAGAGIKMFQVTKQGSIKWADIPEVVKAMIDAEAIIENAKSVLKTEYIEQFRGPGSQYWSVIMDKKGLKK